MSLLCADRSIRRQWIPQQSHLTSPASWAVHKATLSLLQLCHKVCTPLFLLQLWGQFWSMKFLCQWCYSNDHCAWSCMYFPHGNLLKSIGVGAAGLLSLAHHHYLWQHSDSVFWVSVCRNLFERCSLLVPAPLFPASRNIYFHFLSSPGSCLSLLISETCGSSQFVLPAFGVRCAGNSPVVLPSVLLSFHSPFELLNHVDVECLWIIFPYLCPLDGFLPFLVWGSFLSIYFKHFFFF